MSSKLREALEEAVKVLEAIKFESGGRISFGDLVRFNNTKESLKSALAEPLRNCDRFGDLKAAQRFYIEHGCSSGLGLCVDGEIRKFPWKSQFEKWLFAPATE